MPHNTRQTVAVVDCFDSLRLPWRGRQDVFVGSDQFVYWDEQYDPVTNKGNPRLAPDVYVVFGVANRHRKTYVAWEEGKPPTSCWRWCRRPPGGATRLRGRSSTRRWGGGARVLPLRPGGQVGSSQAGFELPRRGCRTYRPLPTEQFGDDVAGIRSNVLGVWRCVRHAEPEPMVGSVVCYDPAAGTFLPYDLHTRAEASDARAEQAAAEVAALKAQIAKLQGERE